MSQNAHTLHLFFEDPIKLKSFQLVYQYLAADNTEQAQRWAGKLGGADLSALWDAQWFNQEVAAKPTHLQLCFDTGTHDDLPLRALEELFAHGLQGAVLEVFYDQVGETERMHFDHGQWVPRTAFFEAHPQWRAVVEPVEADGGDAAPGDGSAEDRYRTSKDPAKPVAIAKLRQQEAKRKKKGEEAAQAFLDMAREMGKSGQSPVQGLIGVLLLRAALKGLLRAAAFTVVTVLLFKGLWLWLGLGLVLAIVLPLYYLVSAYKDLRGDGDGDDGADAEETPAAAADASNGKPPVHARLAIDGAADTTTTSGH